MAIKILICHERFLFRYGVDRVLIILGKGLKEKGHTIYFMGNRFDREILRPIASRIIEVPAGNDFLAQNEFTLEWLKNNWQKIFSSDDRPDIVVVGGWPFLKAIPFFREKGCRVVFSDHGIVPLSGYSGSQLIALNKLKMLKKQYLGDSTAIVGVSDFIVRSQSLPYGTGKGALICHILNGVDHLDMGLWKAESLHMNRQTEQALNKVNALKAEGKKVILLLGRWEINCYKNVEAAFDIMPKILKVIPECVMVVLANPEDVTLPNGMQECIIPIGFPDDSGLKKIMTQVDLGLSVSRWEGFNLPLGEMQWLNQPVLAFNIGAHPEVIVHPWYLCENNDEMAEKAIKILSGDGLDEDANKRSLEKFHSYFTWSRAIKEYSDLFEKLLNDNVDHHVVKPLRLIIDVTNASKDPANSGVIRVTRRLSRELQRYIDPIFVIWDEAIQGYVLPTRCEYEQLGQFNGPIITDERRISHDGYRITLQDYLPITSNDPAWLLFTETVDETHARIVRRYARQNGIHLAAIFYDAIPIINPEMCKDMMIKNNHANYMKGLAECDVVIPISKFSAECLERYWHNNHITGTKVYPNILPGEFGGYPRINEPQKPEKIDILCVSTLEPRKNHRKLLEACLLMEKEHPELDWSLTLVGNRSAGSQDIADYVESISSRHNRIKWLGVVDDNTLHRLYMKAAFTVYPSIIEGFGMPILESIWHGKPCICSSDGVMAELASEGGCLTTNVHDEKALANAIYRLATDRGLLARLSKQAIERKIRSWNDYTLEFLSILSRESTVQSQPSENDLEKIPYPDYKCDRLWMDHPERLALASILSILTPLCCIEVGPYNDESLLLISQHSKIVFSINNGPEVPDNLKYPKNVTFVSGPPSYALSILLTELDHFGIGVDLILINGCRCGEEVKANLNSVLTFVPKKPLIVLVNDSYNMDVRKELINMNWNGSPYVYLVDLDFIPTFDRRIHGGLALVYLKPNIRKGPLMRNIYEC
ncbi:Glycosyltransferase [Methanocella conradii HZ254]|uniref:Glycosyltransferase n=1 Tax=Methanocella conradii (strain DSM 24694 / JCM 17849 / CGMCC 1.5162 / HZ254) TaxID=1041930 RepID=H8I6Q8_METCZ|nr:glycosyltransferase [Methanocella conradii]AFC99378.1 Glycosyltransferase [Methanocella conradii HZ254]